MVSLAPITDERPVFAITYAWAEVAVMRAFWVSFVIFPAEPRQVVAWWPLPTIDRVASPRQAVLAACIDLALVAAFGLQHSVMARPWFKRRWLRHPMCGRPAGGLGHAADELRPLAVGLALTAYVLIAMRYEEHDLLHRFGRRYADWRGVP